MHEVVPSGSPATSDALDHVLAHAVEIAKGFRAEIPGWVAAELTFGQLRSRSENFRFVRAIQTC